MVSQTLSQPLGKFHVGLYEGKGGLRVTVAVIILHLNLVENMDTDLNREGENSEKNKI